MNTVAETFRHGLQRMDELGVDTIVLALSEEVPKPGLNGQWLDMKRTGYYPYDSLVEEEQELILQEKSYQRLALVRAGTVDGITRSSGIESVYRSRLGRLLLPRLVPESPLYYITDGRVSAGSQLDEFAKDVQGIWQPQQINDVIEQGLYEGVLKNISTRKESLQEKLFSDMRAQIYR